MTNPIHLEGRRPNKANGAAENDAPDKANGAATPTIWDPLALVATAEFFKTKPPPRDYLLRDARREPNSGVLVRGKVAALVAEGGAGKTQSASDLAVAVATGGNWFGCIRATKPGRVLVVFGEEDKDEAQRRAYTSCLGGAAVPAGKITYLPLHGVWCAMLERNERKNTVETAFLGWLRSYVERTGPYALIILDPLTRFAGPEAEKDNAEGTRFVQALESLVSPSGGAAIMVAHHTNKLGRDGKPVGTAASRGSSSLTDGFRWVATMSTAEFVFTDPLVQERLGEVVTISFTKSNYTKKGQSIHLRRGERGALVPLDDADLGLIREAESGAERKASKKAEREAERDRTREERAAKEAAARASKDAAKLEDRQRRDAEDDAAATRLHTANPSMALRNLIALFKRERTCGAARATDALKRVKPSPVPAVPAVPAVPESECAKDSKDASPSPTGTPSGGTGDFFGESGTRTGGTAPQ